MILTKVQTTAKQRTEFRLLVAIHFACVMAKAQGYANPMHCLRVQKRTDALANHLVSSHPSLLFKKQYIQTTGELGQQFSLRYSKPNQGMKGTVTVWDNSTASMPSPLNSQNA